LPAWLLAGLLALATVVLYWPALQHGFVNYDDDRYVTANPQVQKGLTLETLRWAFVAPVADNWHPLTVFSHLLVCQIAGLEPWGHHLASVLLHAANAALVFLWLRRMTGAVWKSLIVAALFAAHPLRVESVAWVAERKDVLSGLFACLTLIAYTRYAQAQNATRDGYSFLSSRAYWLAWFWFALGLLSKPMLVTWPFVLLLLDYWPLSRFTIYELRITILRRLVMEKIPFFALAAAVCVVTLIVQQHGAAVESFENLPPVARFDNALIAYCRYLGKMIWPTDLAVLYPHPGQWPMAEVFLASGLLLAVSVLVVSYRRRHPYLLVGWLWFLGTLIPVIGLVQVGLQSMADRYTYLPSLGILLLIVWGTDGLTRKWRFRVVPLAVAASVAILLCLVLTRVQLQYWQDGETLFRRAVAVTENNYIAHYNLGVALDDRGGNEAAIGEYQAALQIHPNYARAEINLGLDLDKVGRTDDAMREYQAAIRAAPDNADARNNLGIALFKQGQNEEAIRQLQEAIRLAPANASAHNNLAAALYTQGQTEEAIQQFQEALRLAPDYAEAHYNLACILAKRGQTNDAVQHFQAALRLKPDYAAARDELSKTLEKQSK
jgi:tetratricopeptide (TPR) repeat protein